MNRFLRRALLGMAASLLVLAQTGCGSAVENAAAASSGGATVNSSLFDAGASDSAGATQESANNAAQDGTAAAVGGDGVEMAPSAELDEAYTYLLTMESVTANNGDVTIDYPQISEWTSDEGDRTADQDRWNQFFRTQAENILSTQGEKDSCEIHYTVVTKDPWLLSLRGDGYFYPDGAAHPYATCVTYNIYMQTGAAATLADTANLEAVADLLMNPDDRLEIGTEGVTMEDIFTYQGIDGSDRDAVIELLRDFDISPDKTEYPTGYSYWDGDALHLLFEIYHAAGDFVDVTLSS